MATYSGDNSNNTGLGTTGDDTLIGGFGNDTLTGDSGNDLIYGEDRVNPGVIGGANTGTASNLTYTNNTTETLYIYQSFADGSVSRMTQILPGATITQSVPLDASRSIGNFAGTEFYAIVKMPGVLVTSYTITSSNDSIDGGSGNDTILAQVGTDLVYGGAGNDVIDGGTGNDTISGDGDNDSLSGGDGNDSILGGIGNDTIGGGNGDDTLDGGNGLDSIHGDAGNDHITGGDNADFISGDGGNDTISGDAGDDTLHGGLGDDFIAGGDGADNIEGGSGIDILLGDAGSDTIAGGADNDSIDGGIDDDLLTGGTGDDTVLGGDGNDQIDGGAGADSLIGGIGDDTIYGNSSTGAVENDLVIDVGTTTTNNIGVQSLDNSTQTFIPNYWTTATVDGVPYVFSSVRAYDGYLDIYRLNDDGSLTKTDGWRYQDGSAGPQNLTTDSGGDITSSLPTALLERTVFGYALSGVEVIDINGVNTMFVTSQNGSGLTAWEFNSDGTIDLLSHTQYGDVGSATRDHAFFTDSDGTLHIYASRNINGYISQLTYDGTSQTFTQDTTTTAVGSNTRGLEVLEVNGSSYLASSNNYGVQLFSIDSATGGLTLVSEQTTTSVAGGNFQDVDSYVKPDGTVYLVYTNGAANQLTLFRVDAGGALTPTDVLTGVGSYQYQDTDMNYINGEPVIIVTDTAAGMTRLYTINSDGGLTLETEVNTGTYTANNAPLLVQSPDGSYYLFNGTSGTSYKLNIMEQISPDNDHIDGGDGMDHLFGQEGDDTILGQAGADVLDGGIGNDSLDGGSEADQLTGGEGFDTFVAGTGDTITDFNTATGQDFTDGDQTNNDYVDLSAYYNATNMALYNAANGTDYKNPLAWLHADQADGVLNFLDGTNGLPTLTMTINNGGSAVGANDLTYDNTNVVCFGSDALITTANGNVAAGDLEVGDLIETVDAGLQPIRWIGIRRLDAATLDAHPKLRPIRICAGALGDGLPAADLIVSPQHRILIRSKIALKMFGTTEVLVAAKQLSQIDGIEIAADLTEVTYVHFLFDAHQLVFANGAETESLYTGAEALKSVGAKAQEEIFTIFPELRDQSEAPIAARELLTGRLGRKLAMRHKKNGKVLVF